MEQQYFINRYNNTKRYTLQDIINLIRTGIEVRFTQCEHSNFYLCEFDLERERGSVYIPNDVYESEISRYLRPTVESSQEEYHELSTDDIDDIINNIYGEEPSQENIQEEELNNSNIIEEESINTHTEIPINSNTWIIDNTTTRFSGALWFEEVKKQNIILAGLGGIGSWVSLLLGRLKVNTIELFDNDIVDEGNLSGQLYATFNIDGYKASACASMLNNYCNYNKYSTHIQRYERNSIADNIMICGFDNMIARKIFFSNWYDHVQSLPEEERKNCLFIDGRLSMNEFQIYCLQGDNVVDIRKYNENALFKDYEADSEICSMKQTSFVANMIASTMVNLLVNFCANKCDSAYPFTLPYLTTYNSDLMLFKTIG